MKTRHRYLTIQRLIETISEVEFPEFQREPIVWDLERNRG